MPLAFVDVLGAYEVPDAVGKFGIGGGQECDVTEGGGPGCDCCGRVGGGWVGLLWESLRMLHGGRLVLLLLSWRGLRMSSSYERELLW